MSFRTEYLAALKAAIVLRHYCKATHRESVSVREMFAGDKTLWEGEVEVFDLHGHRSASVCYAWSHPGKDEVKMMTVLGSRVIDSPGKAVRAAIFTDVQPPQSPLFAIDPPPLPIAAPPPPLPPEQV